MNNDNELRICRIATFPTAQSPGTGLPSYRLAADIDARTLYLTRKVPGLLSAPDGVTLAAIDYPSPAFSERIEPATALIKVVGILKFFIMSIPCLLAFRPRIVHIHSPLYLPHALFARLFLRSKICYTLHGSDLVRIKRSVLLKRLLRRIVDRFFYVSRAMEKDLLAFLDEDVIHYTPNGVDRSIFKNEGLPREDIVVAVGNLRWQKGYEHLIEAFSRVRENGWKLIVVGEGPERGKLERLIAEKRLEGIVELVGRRNHEEIAELMNICRFFVLSSVTEGFPKVLVEAMACGLPVVATDVGSCREVAEGAGIIVPPADPARLSEAMLLLMNDEPMRRMLSAEAESRARRYDWLTSSRVVASVYNELVAGVRVGLRVETEAEDSIETSGSESTISASAGSKNTISAISQNTVDAAFKN